MPASRRDRAIKELLRQARRLGIPVEQARQIVDTRGVQALRRLVAEVKRGAGFSAIPGGLAGRGGGSRAARAEQAAGTPLRQGIAGGPVRRGQIPGLVQGRVLGTEGLLGGAAATAAAETPTPAPTLEGITAGLRGGGGSAARIPTERAAEAAGASLSDRELRSLRSRRLRAKGAVGKMAEWLKRGLVGSDDPKFTTAFDKVYDDFVDDVFTEGNHRRILKGPLSRRARTAMKRTLSQMSAAMPEAANTPQARRVLSEMVMLGQAKELLGDTEFSKVLSESGKKRVDQIGREAAKLAEEPATKRAAGRALSPKGRAARPGLLKRALAHPIGGPIAGVLGAELLARPLIEGTLSIPERQEAVRETKAAMAPQSPEDILRGLEASEMLVSRAARLSNNDPQAFQTLLQLVGGGSGGAPGDIVIGSQPRAAGAGASVSQLEQLLASL